MHSDFVFDNYLLKHAIKYNSAKYRAGGIKAHMYTIYASFPKLPAESLKHYPHPHSANSQVVRIIEKLLT